MTASPFAIRFQPPRDRPAEMEAPLACPDLRTALTPTKVTFCIHGVISPLLANIYLHYVFDLWANPWRKRHAEGNIVIVRYADDTVVGFDKARDARRSKRAMQERLEQFALSVRPEKTRLIELGRFPAANRAKRGLGKPETFNFLGLTHISGRARSGKFMLRRKTRRDRFQATLRAIKDELRRRWHHSIPEQGKWLRQVVQGYFNFTPYRPTSQP